MDTSEKSKAPLTEHREDAVMEGSTCEPDLVFMRSVGGQVWEHLGVHSEFVPKMASISSDLRYSPQPGIILAWAVGCGRGKSFQFREYMKRTLEDSPHMRVLLFSANVLYGTNLAHELEQCGFNVGFYKNKETNLENCQVVVCSFESLHLIDGQQFHLMLIDEIRSVATLVGGGTMSDFTNVYLLRELCHTTPRIVVCDADLLYTAHESEPQSAVHDFLQLIAPRRKVRCVKLTHPGPPHLRRSARFFYDSKNAGCGKDEWLDQIRCAAQDWRRFSEQGDNTHRFAVCTGSKKQLNEVCALLRQVGVPFKPYSGDTNDIYKLEDLKDPDVTWLDVGGVAATTTLSIGVDPKKVQFARVFIWTCRMGCDVLTQAQAAQRFGRNGAFPLLNETIDILLDCMPPDSIRELVAAGQREPVRVFGFEDVLVKLQKRRGRRASAHNRLIGIGGGVVEGVKSVVSVADQLLMVMAHKVLERQCQMTDMHAAMTRVCRHHNWEVVPSNISLRQLAIMNVPTTVEIDPDDAFVTLTDVLEKFKKCLEYVANHGEDSFFNDCYQIEQKRLRSGFEKWLYKMYWLLQPIGELTCAETLTVMHKPGTMAGLHLNALCRCTTSELQMKIDRLNRLDPERKSADPYLKTDMGSRMEAADECAALLGLESLASECTLPVTVVEMVERDNADAGLTPEDVEFINRLKYSAEILDTTTSQTLEGIIGDVAKACGMRLEKERSRKMTNGSRKRKLIGMRLERVCPDIVSRWLVKSDRLGKRVRVQDWQQEHTELDEEEHQACLMEDDELDDDVFTPLTDEDGDVACVTARSGVGEASDKSNEEDIPFSAAGFVLSNRNPDERVETIDGVGLSNSLRRLKAIDKRTPQQERWLQTLLQYDAAAIPRMGPDEEPPTFRYNYVSYGKRRAIGRRTASYPSQQGCPSGLKKVLVGRTYHDVDIVACHPTLHLQVASKMNVEPSKIALLVEYVNDCHLFDNKNDIPMLVRIGQFYGVPADTCKYAALRVLNGGSIMAWIRDAKCTRNTNREQTDLRELQRIATLVREVFFEMPQFKEQVQVLRSQLENSTQCKVDQAIAQLSNAKKSRCVAKAAEKTLNNALHKASPTAIDRSIFALCVFELEDMILAKIDEHLRSTGWNVGSLVFDGLLVEHRPGVDLTGALRGAEKAVMTTLAYNIKLVEKPLFEARSDLPSSGEEMCIPDDEMCISDGEL